MSSISLARPVLRHSGAWSRMAARRFESTASKATETAKDSALSKAQEGLSKVTSSAGPAIAGAAQGVAKSLSKVGGRTATIVSFVEKQVPKVVYYAKVGAEVGKIVFRGQKMTPPSIETFQTYFQNAWKNPSSLLQSANTQNPVSLSSRFRNVTRAQLVAGGVIFAECLGFFTVGEMIGRFKVVGYHGEVAAAHH